MTEEQIRIDELIKFAEFMFRSNANENIAKVIDDYLRTGKSKKTSMTWAEAKNIISKMIKSAETLNAYEYALLALRTAEKALEKQIPKNPMEKEIYFDGETRIVEYRCSVCGRYICDQDEENHEEYHEICACGNAIDWSETNSFVKRNKF